MLNCRAILDISRNNLCNAYMKKNLILKRWQTYLVSK